MTSLTKKQNPKQKNIFSLQTWRLAKSFESLNSCLVQGWTISSPQATCGPPQHFQWSTEAFRKYLQMWNCVDLHLLQYCLRQTKFICTKPIIPAPFLCTINVFVLFILWSN